jgi:2-polyprenyl-6-methoxyphenol hydroxylase-like FAD-dependent oxidoreductase
VKALIVGGGIGGLTCSIALAKIGVEPVVFEQAPALREAGAGLTLWSNATRVLGVLGLLPDILAVSAPLQRGRICNAAGRVLADIPLGELADKLAGPIVGIHRADLLNVLARAVPADRVRLSARVERFTEGQGSVTVHLLDGREETGDLLVGADGIHSRIREQGLGDPQRYCGYVGWRGAARFAHPLLTPGLSIWSYGRGSQVGLIPIGGGRVFWFATATMPESDIARLGPHHEELCSRFLSWHEPIPALLRSLAGVEIVRTPIYDRPPVTSWGGPRTTLLGDSAHATTPTLGQGACLAIESALVLARCLLDGSAVDSSLREYERLRQERTARIIRQSWDLGKKIQWRGALSCWLRDQVIRWTPLSWHMADLERIIAPGCVDREWGAS